MNMKKMVSCLVAGSMLTMAVSAFAQIPETQVSTINNAAVVAFDGVNAHQSMNIEGDVYAGGQVKFDNAGENYLDGDIISSQEVSYQDEYSAILKDTNRKGVDKVEENMSKYLDAYLKENCGEFFADLQLYQTGPMNYVVVAVYYDVPGVGEALPKILGFVNAKYREVVGHNVRRKQILKFDLAKKLHGQSEVCLHASSEEMEESEDEQPREDYASSTGEEIRQERNDTTS